MNSVNLPNICTQIKPIVDSPEARQKNERQEQTYRHNKSQEIE